MVDGLFELFSWFCGQPADRCFVIDGRMLPVCQRCLGVYCGLLFGVLTVPGAFQRVAVFPGRAGLAIVGAAVACMFVMGLHWIDPGPIARFLGGYGYAAALVWLAFPVAKAWLLGFHFRAASNRETLLFLALSTLIAGLLALGLPLDRLLLFFAFSAVATAGWGTGVGLAASLIIGFLAFARHRSFGVPATRRE